MQAHSDRTILILCRAVMRVEQEKGRKGGDQGERENEKYDA